MSCHEVAISISAASLEADLANVRTALAAVPTAGFAEIHVSHDQFPSLSALLNGGVGWLMYLRYDGDAGFSSRNPGFSGSPTEVIKYELSNGQLDEYPASWAYPRNEVLAALEFFARHRRVPESIRWWNDSGDGKISPNEAG
jgi:hypothetical protein